MIMSSADEDLEELFAHMFSSAPPPKNTDEAVDAWKTKLPVIWRLGAYNTAESKTNLWMRIPFSSDNRQWLSSVRDVRITRANKPYWDPACKRWELCDSWFNDLFEKSLGRFRQVWLIQPLNRTEKCAPACRNATGHDCECSCLGQHHGQGDDGTWFDVDETFSIRSLGREWAVGHYVWKSPKPAPTAIATPKRRRKHFVCDYPDAFEVLENFEEFEDIDDSDTPNP
jgi:hypothetical protein